MRTFFLACSLLSLSTSSFFACSSGDVTPDPLGEGADGNPHGPGSPDDGVDQDSGTNGGTGGNGLSDGGNEPVYETICTPACSDEPPPDQDPTCAQWKEWGTCGAEWFVDYCQETCGTCSGEEEVCERVLVSGGTGGTGNSSGDLKYTDPNAKAPPLGGNVQNGWASRYWDCCKPHCAWPGNGPQTMNMCTIDNQPLSDEDASSGCGGGSAFTCWNMAPWAVSETLAYGYAATPAGGNDCGKCYQLEFTGAGQHTSGDPGSASLAGKTMIVQSTNIGGDVGSGQFDLLLPGGGVGMYNGCTTQWGTGDLGPTHGGFLADCNDDVNCLRDKCEAVFGQDSKFQELYDGCMFHVEWMKGANNPKLRYAEVACPAELEGLSGMSL